MVRADTLAKTLLAMIEESDKDADAVIDQFLSFANERNILFMIPDVIRFLENRDLRDKEASELKVSTAHDVPSETIEAIRSYVGAPDDAGVNHTVDEDIVGGFQARFNNIQYDASLRHNVEKLRRSLRG